MLSRGKSFIWDQKRFSLLLHGSLSFPVHICYLNGMFIGGKWSPNNPCWRQGTKLKLRILPIEKYPLGPAFMWGKLHCSIPFRDEQYLEQLTSAENALPLCNTLNSTDRVIVVHGAGLLDISKIYFFRDRQLWFLNESLRFQNRALVSISQESNLGYSNIGDKSLTEEAMLLAQQIAWTMAIEGDLVLPLFDCMHVPNAVEGIQLCIC